MWPFSRPSPTDAAILLLAERIHQMAQELDDLKREVLETKDSVQKLIDFVKGVQAQLADVQQKLADAIAANDPAAIEQAAQDLDAVQKSIDPVINPTP